MHSQRVRVLVGALCAFVAAVACVRGTRTSERPIVRTGAQGATPLVGAWRLVAILDSLPDGHTASWMGARPQGLLVYAADGHMAAQIMNPDRPRFAGHGAAAPDGTVRAAYDTYYAYYGRYTVFPDSQVVVHHVDGSLEPAEVGLDYRRPYRLDGDRLQIRSAPERGGVRYHRWLTWERAR